MDNEKIKHLKNRWQEKDNLIKEIITRIKNNNETWINLINDLDYVNEVEGKRDLRGIPLRGYNLTNISFNNIDFEFADFRETDLSNSTFKNVNLKNTDLRDAILYNTDFQTADLRKCNLENVKIDEDTDFGPLFLWQMDKRKKSMSKFEYFLNKHIIRLLGYKGKVYSERIAKSKEDYRDVKKLYRSLRLIYRNLDQGTADYFYYREWHCELKLHSIWNPVTWPVFLWEKASCSGTAPLRLFIFILFTISFFAIIYYTFNDGIIRDVIVGENYKREVVCLKNYGEAFYFSVVTITTLGYGDFHPNHDLICGRMIKYVCCIEALIGAVYWSLVVGIFLQFMRKD